MDAEIEQKYFWTKKKRFTCPFIYKSQSPCTSTCFHENCRTYSEVENESFQQLRIVQVKKEVVFDHDLCVEWGYEKEEENLEGNAKS